MFAIDMDFLNHGVALLDELRATGEMSEPELRADFLLRTLGEWDSPMCDGMDTPVGHLLYRLTDFMDPDERRRIRLFRSDDGKDTVEDWRREWESLYSGCIPEIPQAQLQSIQLAITAGTN
jgi:hypothetical protein